MEKDKNKDVTTSERTRSNGSSGIIIFLAVLALLLAVGAALVLRQMLKAKHEAQVASTRVEHVSEERDTLLKKLDELEASYATLSSTNTELESQLVEERRRVNQLRAQIRAGVSGEGDAGPIRQRIEELEAQLEEYRQQAEFMEAEKQSLAAETAQMRSALTQTASRNQELETKNRELEEQVEKAGFLTISNLEGTALRERRRGDEPTDRARRTDKLRVCFTINQNLVANPGNRDFFVRLIDPSNQVLSTSPDNTLEFEGETIQYSIRRTINFQNNSQDVCVVWDQSERFEKGYYNVVVFTEGNEVGYKLFQLD